MEMQGNRILLAAHCILRILIKSPYKIASLKIYEPNKVVQFTYNQMIEMYNI